MYKYYFCQKHGIDPKDVETYFALMKRIAKKDSVEIFRVTSGQRKVQNAMVFLNKAVLNIKRKFTIKNRLSCTSGYGCEFYKTKYCT